MNQEKLDLESGKKAIKLARRSIESEFKDVNEEISFSETFSQERGVFVTLHEEDELRGCIGRPYPTQELKKGIMEAAKDAAFNDPRFPSLNENELDYITVELTILTEPEKIRGKPKQRKEKIEIGKHGLIAQSGPRKGLLLPQVPVDNQWSQIDFLSNTCLKAGLKSDAWLDEEVDFYKFQGQIFKEKTPRGEVIERKIDESN